MHHLRPWPYALAVLFALSGTPALAHDYALKGLRIIDPYARATPSGARTGAVYLTIENHGAANDELIHVASPVADTAEMHVMRMHGSLMQTRPVTAIGVPAGANVTLAPDGYHVMLIGLRQALVADEDFPLTLTFAKAGTIELRVRVIALTAPVSGGETAARTHR
ncbi:MAG: copper chaperone PCu(A)C [Casimicrobiaceae bacterium]